MVVKLLFLKGLIEPVHARAEKRSTGGIHQNWVIYTCTFTLQLESDLTRFHLRPRMER